MNSTEPTTDLLVVGAGVVGLAHAAEGLRRGLNVTLVERDTVASGASVRNFGHVCATAQSGRALQYAMAGRERWIDLGAAAGFDVQQVGTAVVARHEDELALLEQFVAERGEAQARLRTPEALGLTLPGVLAAAHLPLDLRVNSPEAIPALAAYLASSGVDVRFGTHVKGIEQGEGAVRVRTNRGTIVARAVIHAVGHDVDRLYPELAESVRLRRCRLQMLEVALPSARRWGPAVLTGLSMLRYGGLAAQPAAAAVRERIAAENPELLEVVMNLMFTQRPDGSIVLGDTHVDEETTSPFDDEAVAELLLREGATLFGETPRVLRRWRGVYAHSQDTDFLVRTPSPDVRVVSVTSGIGMTTSPGLAVEVLDSLSVPAAVGAA